MSPNKLFDYLDGKLPDWERKEVEEQLAADPQLREELAMARRIQSHGSNDSREVLLPDDATSARGRKMATRVGIAFILLIALNVGIGLIVIARKEAANPNHKLLEDRMREQLTRSLQQSAHLAMPPPALGVVDLTIPAAPGKLDAVAEQVIAAALRLGGSATKELPSEHRVGVLVDLAASREAEFRAAIGAAPAAATVEQSVEKKSFVIQIVELGAP